jgi:hypothetical protein
MFIAADACSCAADFVAQTDCPEDLGWADLVAQTDCHCPNLRKALDSWMVMACHGPNLRKALGLVD